MLHLKRNYFTFVIDVICIAALLCFIFCIARGFLIAGTQTPDSFSLSADTGASLSDISENWISDTDGTAVNLGSYIIEPGETVIFTKKIQGMLDADQVLYFDNNRLSIQIEADGIAFYSAGFNALSSQISYSGRRLATIPDGENVSRLTVTLYNPENRPVTLGPVLLGDSSAAAYILLKDNLITLLLLVILGFILALVVLATIFCYSHQMGDARFHDLIVYLILVGAWCFCDSDLPAFAGIPQECAGMICYLSLCAIPLPTTHYIWVSTQKKYRSLLILSAVAGCNLIGQSLLSLLGIISLQHTFFISHVLVGVMILISLIALYRYRKLVGRNSELILTNFGLVSLGIMTLLGLGLYWYGLMGTYRNMVLIGVMTFVVFLICSIVVHFIELYQSNSLKISEIRLQQQLALHDTLTGLENRRAFERKMDEIEATKDTIRDAVMIMFDVNGLKKINDTFGHSAGDELIVAAGNLIQMTYAEDAFCYRLGGDEFVVVMIDPGRPLSEYSQEFHENIIAANAVSPWQISIAKGESHLRHPSGQFLSISDWKQAADVNMYRDKLAINMMSEPQNMEDLRNILDCVITTVEVKDAYTADHSDRVRELSLCIASKLGVTEETLKNIETASRLHDIGKIGIPDHVLTKPGSLTNEEYKIIQKHSRIGAYIISKAEGMKEISEIILHHHERWDGKGYPDGLAGSEIPMESRIIAIADSIDAMTSKRCYRDSLSLETCKAEIAKGSGSMYDPAIAEITLENWQEITEILMLHPKRLLHQEDALSNVFRLEI